MCSVLVGNVPAVSSSFSAEAIASDTNVETTISRTTFELGQRMCLEILLDASTLNEETGDKNGMHAEDNRSLHHPPAPH